MVVNAVEIVRKIRDKHFEETKDLSVEDQIRTVRQKAGRLQKELRRLRRPIRSATQ